MISFLNIHSKNIGLVLPAIAVTALCFVTCSDPYVGVAFLTIGLATTGCGYGAGFMVNYNDIGGPFAGLIFGMVNTFGTMPGIIAPYIVGVITKDVRGLVLGLESINICKSFFFNKSKLKKNGRLYFL